MKKKKLKKLSAVLVAVCVCLTNTMGTYAVSDNSISCNCVLDDGIKEKEDLYTISTNNVLELSVSKNEPVYKDAEYVVYVEDESREIRQEVEEVMEGASDVVEEQLEDATLYVADLTDLNGMENIQKIIWQTIFMQPV